MHQVLLSPTRTRVNALSDLTTSRGFNTSVVGILGLLVEKAVTDSGNPGLNPCSLLHRCRGVCPQCGQTDTTGPTSGLVRPFTDHTGHAAEEGVGTHMSL